MGAARSFASTPVPSQPRPELSLETTVPAYVKVGARIQAMGWYAGAKKWFSARVVKVSSAFPKIHVRFVADEEGNMHALALPELDAYLHAGDIAPIS